MEIWKLRYRVHAWNETRDRQKYSPVQRPGGSVQGESGWVRRLEGESRVGLEGTSECVCVGGASRVGPGSTNSRDPVLKGTPRVPVGGCWSGPGSCGIMGWSGEHLWVQLNSKPPKSVAIQPTGETVAVQNPMVSVPFITSMAESSWAWLFKRDVESATQGRRAMPLSIIGANLSILVGHVAQI